jgi:hypothetical protein
VSKRESGGFELGPNDMRQTMDTIGDRGRWDDTAKKHPDLIP